MDDTGAMEFPEFSRSSQPPVGRPEGAIAGGILSVGGLTDYLKALVEGDAQLSAIAVAGEVSSANLAKSGLFFTLRDPASNATLSAVLWRWQLSQQPAVPEVGQQFVVVGKLQIYAPRSDYKIVADRVFPIGAGLQALQRQQLRDRLRLEGLFDTDRKRALPIHPQTIGVISSPQAAAWGDIQRTLTQRYPGLHVLFAPAIVQGDLAPDSIARAFDRLAADGRAEVVILARGGGAREDLAAFDDERVVRAIVLSPVPVITGLGHQRDESLADLAADDCAHTPTAAAERVAPSLADLSADLRHWRDRLQSATQTQLDRQQQRLEHLNSAAIVASLQTRLDRERATVTALGDRLRFAVRARLDRERQQCAAWRETLTALDPHAVLRRGYALLRDRSGAIVRSAADVRAGDRLVVRLGDGELDVAAIDAGRDDREQGRDRRENRGTPDPEAR